MKYTLIIISLLLHLAVSGQEKVFPGADEKTPSRAQYFSWINNTNEGPTEEHTMINLKFFEWLKSEYGMQLEIYAFDAGAIDGAKFYGSIYSDRFKKQFPNGFDPIYKKAKEMGIRLGVWGGPDGFGTTSEDIKARNDQMVKLCKDYDFMLFKFDKVCGSLPLEREDDFISMMKECREHSPDLILLNHRLGLKKSLPYATTFLWEGVETYTDCHIWNTTTAPHHRAGALSRGLPPGFKRLTEDHGVCLSSCLDGWDDELVLQAFNRSLILAPEIYGNPWLLSDDEYSRMARIFNIHKKYSKILVNGKILPEKQYGKYAVSRGDSETQFITLRNLSWEPKTFKIDINKTIGLNDSGKGFKAFVLHPYERFLGTKKYGSQVEVEVLPFKVALVKISSRNDDDIYVEGCDYSVVRNVYDKSVKIRLEGESGTSSKIKIHGVNKNFRKASVDGKLSRRLAKGIRVKIKFDGTKLSDKWHRKVAEMNRCSVPEDAATLYESTCYSADNNALEVRSLMRSGETKIPEVKSARDAFFNQKRFVERGVWDKYMFDGDLTTSFYVNRRRYKDLKVNGGCLRVDFGQEISGEKLVIKYPDVYALQPLEIEEGIYVYYSNDMKTWEKSTGYIGDDIVIPFPKNKKYRYVRIPRFPDRISEIELLHSNGKQSDRKNWRASNLFADYSKLKTKTAWSSSFKIDEVYDGSFLCVAINGKHGDEGAYAALKVDGKYIGAPDRSISYPSNTWESAVCHKNRFTENYTYYIPLEKWMEGKSMEAFVLVNSDATELKPEVWITSHKRPVSYREIELKR